MDVDAFVLAHRPMWDRLEALVKRRRRLTGAEVDELVDLYQRVSTHLSMVRTASTDSVLVGTLSGLVAGARSAVTGAHAPLWSEFVRFWTVSFPVVAYRGWRWWLGTAVAFFFVVVVVALWVSGNPEVQSSLKTPSEIEQLVNHDFASYYSENPPGSFAVHVILNNSWVSAQCIAFAILLGIPGVLIGGVLVAWALLNRSNTQSVPIGALKGDPKDIARLLFHDFLLPFEVTSVLILIAIMGAVVLASRPRAVPSGLRKEG